MSVKALKVKSIRVWPRLTSNLFQIITFKYDPFGRRIYKSSSAGTSIYAYDNNGNAQTKVVGTNTTTYAWDYENRMTSVTLPAGGGTVRTGGPDANPWRLLGAPSSVCVGGAFS